jgi:Reverse transcriptase (RNA-dependent DNA polymerase)
MVSRVLRVRHAVDRSVMHGVVRGCVEVQGLMEAKRSETKEATGSDGDDVESRQTWTRMEVDVGDRDRRSGDGDQRSEIGGWNDMAVTCPDKCRKCHSEVRAEWKEQQKAECHIHACCSGPNPLLAEVEHIRATGTTSQRLAEALQKHAKAESEIPEYLREFEDVFAKESFDALPVRKVWDHAIELEPVSKPTNCKVYPLSPKEQLELDVFLKENLHTGWICPSKSPMASPVFFIKKKDGSLRLVQDYCTLNAVTVKNQYPIPLIYELITQLRGAQYFTKLDVRWGFNNVRIREGDEWKAAFRTN